ncbi:MAG: flagellar hook-length control protein FliK [Pseudohongiellaceae bacterium]
MANLQSVLMPVLGASKALGQAKAAAILPTGESEARVLNSMGNENPGGFAIADEGEKEKGAFSELLVDSGLSEESKPVQIYQAQAEPESLLMRGGQAFELSEFSGNQFPFWGKSLPIADSPVTTNSPAALVNLKPQVEPDQGSALTPLASEALFQSSEVVRELIGPATVGAPKLGLGMEDNVPMPSIELDVDTQFENSIDRQLVDETSGLETLFSIPSIESQDVSSALKLDFSRVDQHKSAFGTEQEMQEIDAALMLQSEQLELVPLQIKEGVDAAALAATSFGQHSASFEAFSKFMLEHTKQSRLENGAGAERLDSSASYQDVLLDGADIGEIDELLAAKATNLTGRSLTGNSSGLNANSGLEFTLGQSAGVTTTSLSSALSQWKADQDVNPITSADPLERPGALKVTVPFGQAAWGENLGSRLSLLLAKNLDSAQIQLDPPELGPLGVKIQINQDQVSLQFTSAHSAVREALEQSSQKLQQMLEEEGLDLVDVDVSDERRSNDEGSRKNLEIHDSPADKNGSSDTLTDETDSLLTQSQIISVDSGKIDYFA